MKIPLGPIDLLIFQSTSFCNLDCKYCYLPDRDVKNKIDIEKIEITLKRIVEENLIKDSFSIVWHAGEPTVLSIDFYRSVFKLIQEIIPSNIKVYQHIQTNATLLNDEWCEFFIEVDMKVGVSIDGPQHINDRNRVLRNGKGSYEQIITGINYLKKHKIDFSVIAVLTDYSLDFPDEIYYYFKELGGVRSLCFNMDEEDGVNTKSTLNENTEVKLKLFWKRMYQLQLVKGNYMHLREIHGFNEALLKGNFTNNPFYLGQMTQPFKILTIDTYGNFSTFSPELVGMKDEKLTDFNFGNIKNDTFSSVLTNEKFINVFNEILEGVKKCNNECNYFSFCGGGAPSNKLYENGSFNTTETKFCKYSKKILVDAFLEEIEKNLA
jgi:uncharacterized protein